MKSSSYSQFAGFTLLEVILAVTILSLISLGIASGLSAGLKAWEAGERKMAQFQGKRIVTERLIREVTGSINLRGKLESEDYARTIFNGESDSLSFVTTSEPVTSPGMLTGLKEVSIAVSNGDGLVLREALFSNKEFFSNSRGIAYVLDETISSIRFRYLYIPMQKPDTEGDISESISAEWLDTWGPDHVKIEENVEETEAGDRVREKHITVNLPVAVEITLAQSDPYLNKTVEWEPILIPLKESRVMGVSAKRKSR